MSTKTKSTVTLAVIGVGALLGLMLAAYYAPQNLLWFPLIGASLGWRLSQLICIKEQEPHPDRPRRHYHLPREMRDSYYTDLVMKRIMEVYHPGADAADEDENGDEDHEDVEEDPQEPEQDEDEEEEGEEEYSWAGIERDRRT